MSQTLLSRRWVLKAMAASGGVVLFGCRPSADEAVLQTDAPTSFSAMVKVLPDNTVQVVVPRSEMGQDILTGLAKIVADEMDAAWDTLSVHHAPHGEAFYDSNGSQSTGGSNSVRVWYEPLRVLGAQIRTAMITTAADRWGVDPTLCEASDNTVYWSDQSLPYGELAADAVSIFEAVKPRLKDPSQFFLIGKNVPRKDLLQKTTGRAVFGADVRIDNQVFAAVRMSPSPSGKLVSFDAQEAKKDAAVLEVLEVTGGLAVVAEHWWAAHNGLSKVVAEFSDGDDRLDDSGIQDSLSAALDKTGVVAVEAGQPEEILAQHPTKIFEYQVPYVSHACMETMTATVFVEPDRVQVWVPTQSPQRFARRVAKKLGRPLESVELNNVFIGGGFGRKGVDFVVLDQATELSQRLERPVQVMWDRETDFAHDQYRPAAAYRYRGAISNSGDLLAADIRVAAASIRKQRFPEFYRADGHELPAELFDYACANQRQRWCEADIPISVGFWRGVSLSNHPFATESFIDEMAHAAHQDPYQFRRHHLQHRPRAVAVLDAVVALSGWGKKERDGYGLGLAIQAGWDSVCAQVARVSVTEGKIRVHDIWVAVDCGTVISPDTVRAQIESAVIYGLTATLKSKLSFQKSAVLQSNFDDYPILTMAEIPVIDTVILTSDHKPGGVGELGLPPVAPAVANGVFAATGKRLRKLPLQWRDALV